MISCYFLTRKNSIWTTDLNKYYKAAPSLASQSAGIDTLSIMPQCGCENGNKMELRLVESPTIPGKFRGSSEGAQE